MAAICDPRSDLVAFLLLINHMKRNLGISTVASPPHSPLSSAGFGFSLCLSAPFGFPEFLTASIALKPKINRKFLWRIDPQHAYHKDLRRACGNDTPSQTHRRCSRYPPSPQIALVRTSGRAMGKIKLKCCVRKAGVPRGTRSSFAAVIRQATRWHKDSARAVPEWDL